VSTSVNEKTQKMLPVSTNEKAISQKTFFVSTRLDKYNWLLKCHKFSPWIALKSREKHRIIILKCHKIYPIIILKSHMEVSSYVVSED